MADRRLMISPKRTWHIDTTIGGFGDVWMRLNALHALAGIKPDQRFVIRVAPPLAVTAEKVFGERLHFDSAPQRDALVFTHLGLRHLAKDLLRGRRFVNPFHRSNVPVQRSHAIEALNRAAFSALAATGRVFLNDDAASETYGGWMQISDLPPARRIPWDTALEQFRIDFPKLRNRIRELTPPLPDATQPVVFASGSGFQIMPATLAREFLPDARYAFHDRDPYQDTFRAAGLQVVTFSDVPGLLEIASSASAALCTDSFPSHVLQMYSSTTIVALSHFPRNRVVHPAFDGVVLDSAATCCPCLTRARTSDSTCPAGRSFCLTWEDAGYLERLRAAINLRALSTNADPIINTGLQAGDMAQSTEETV